MLYPISNSWSDFDNLILEKIGAKEISKVLEFGAGANPLLSKEKVIQHGLSYSLIDIDSEELAKAPSGYLTKITSDISKNDINQKFDLIFSKMVLEHLESPEKVHKNLLNSAHDDTIFCHFFSTKYGLPSLLNLVLPNRFTDFIVYKIQKRDPSLEGKFSAYYRKCTGPLRSTIKWYSNLGYSIEKFDGYLGHSYTGRNKFLHFFESRLSKLAQKINSPLFCSNAILVMKKYSHND